MRNPLDRNERRTIKAMMTKSALTAMRALARSAGVPDPSVRWRIVDDGPWFDNQVATLQLNGRRMDLRIEKAKGRDGAEPCLDCVLEHRLA